MIGRPIVVEKRSSMKKCNCAIQPTGLPVRLLTGIDASTASCTYCPAQIIPGFTVPVVPLAPRSSAVDMANSTTGIIRLKGSRRPTSCTKDCRYGTLYSTAKPHLSVCGWRSTLTSPSSLTVVELARPRVAGESPLAGCLLYAIVGKDSSSATNGSSITSVAGKNCFPASPCARAGSVATRQVLAASKISGIRPGIAPGRAQRVRGIVGACHECGEADGSLGTTRDTSAKHAGDEVIAGPSW